MIPHLKYAWGWCKVNWKFLLGFAVPIIISILIRRGNEKKILKDGLEFRRKQLELEKKASQSESSMKEKANLEHNMTVSEIENSHLSTLEEIERERNRKILEIDSADAATDAIRERLED